MDFKYIYYPGRLVVLTNELFNKQKIHQKDNSTQYWKAYVDRYFSQNCTYSVIMTRDSRTWTFSNIYIK
jgi:hypothetical protein